MSKKLILYYFRGSMPSRACLMLTKLLNLEVEIKEVNIPKGEQFSEEFAKVNPLKRIPVLVDGDFVLNESRAILAYLVNSKRPGDPLYPIDARKRAIIDSRLYYDGTVFFPNLLAVIRPVVVGKKTEISESLKEPIETSLGILELFLNKTEYFAGENMTIADISILPNVTTAREFGFDLGKYPKINEWHRKMEKIPGFEENLEGAQGAAKYIKYKLGGSIFKENQHEW